MNEDNKKKISKHDFYFETPLYEIINLNDLEEDVLSGDVDAYSAKNGIDTTYRINSESVNGSYGSNFDNFHKVTLICKRKNNDILRFFVYSNEQIVAKFGQYPSLADIQFAEIGKKYDKYLSKPELKEFKRAIGLAAHGVGAGSFVYLRRIFENLIYKTFKKYEKEISIDEKDFKSKRMEDKVEVLKSYLPKQLLDMKYVYSILSKGVHELSEEECLKYFPALKLSVELILEEQIELEKEKSRQEKVKAALHIITKDLNFEKQTNEK